MNGRPGGSDIGSDSPWLPAVLVGVVSASSTTLYYWQTAEFELFVPVFVAGVLVGVLYAPKPARSRRAGALAGFVGSIPSAGPLLDMLLFIPGLDQPIWFGGIQAVLVVVFFGVAIAFAALLGMVGSILGALLAGKAGRRDPHSPRGEQR